MALLEHPDILREVLMRVARGGCAADLCRAAGVCRAFRAELAASPRVWREAYCTAFGEYSAQGSAPGLSAAAREAEWAEIARRGAPAPPQAARVVRRWQGSGRRELVGLESQFNFPNLLDADIYGEPSSDPSQLETRKVSTFNTLGHMREELDSLRRRLQEAEASNPALKRLMDSAHRCIVDLLEAVEPGRYGPDTVADLLEAVEPDTLGPDAVAEEGEGEEEEREAERTGRRRKPVPMFKEVAKLWSQAMDAGAAQEERKAVLQLLPPPLHLPGEEAGGAGGQGRAGLQRARAGGEGGGGGGRAAPRTVDRVRRGLWTERAALRAREQAETERAESQFWKDCIRRACASDPAERLVLEGRLSGSVDGTRRTFKALDRVSGRAVFLKQSDVEEGADSYFLREVAGLKALQSHPGVICLRRVYSADKPTTLAHTSWPGMVHCVELDWIPRTLTDCVRHTNHAMAPVRDRLVRGVVPKDPIPPEACRDHYLLTPETVKLYAFQLVAAVSKMHEHGILHRDLTPYAIRVCEDAREVRLAGLKFARMATIERGNLTAEVVTLWYRPPEVLLGVDLYSTELDMWSLGCTLYEMAAGKAAFPGSSELETLFLIFQKVGSPSKDSFLASLPHAVGQFPQFKPTLRGPKYGADVTGRPNPKVKSTTRLQDALGHRGMDLLERLLEPEPQKRISARDALQHPYFHDSLLDDSREKFGLGRALTPPRARAEPSKVLRSDVADLGGE